MGLDAGASLHVAAAPERRLAFVRSGEGRLGSEAYEALTAAHIEPGQAVTLEAREDSDIFVVTLTLVGERPT